MIEAEITGPVGLLDVGQLDEHLPGPVAEDSCGEAVLSPPHFTTRLGAYFQRVSRLRFKVLPRRLQRARG